jgi:hypothetical protein
MSATLEGLNKCATGKNEIKIQDKKSNTKRNSTADSNG